MYLNWFQSEIEAMQTMFLDLTQINAVGLILDGFGSVMAQDPGLYSFMLYEQNFTANAVLNIANLYSNQSLGTACP